MKAALAIIAAEVRALRMVPLAMLLTGVLNHVLVHVFGIVGPRPLERLHLLAVMVMVAVICSQLGLAAALGAGAVSRDLAERRLGFYLARPVSPLAYWGAKMAAAFLVAYVSGWLILVPGFILGPRPVHWSIVLETIRQEKIVLAGVLATAFLVALAGVAAGSVRSRSGLLLLDVALLALTGTAFLAAVGSTWDAGTTPVVLAYGTPWLLGIAMLVLLAAGAAQVCIGRLDLRRGHVMLSTILWGGLLACAGGIWLFSRQVAGVTPAELRAFPLWVRAPQTGQHVLIEGVDGRWRGLHAAAFFLDAQGRFTSAGGASWVTGSAWSADGRSFAWSKGGLGTVDARSLLRAVPGFNPSLWIMRFDQPDPVPRLVARRRDEWEGVHALSPSGQRLLVASPRGKSVIDVDSGRTIASIAESPTWTNARFLSETMVRALRMGPADTRIVDWELSGGRLTERGAIALQGGRSASARLIPTEDWQRVLRFDGTGLFLHDLDGRLLATLVDGWPTARNSAAGILSDGRFGSVEEDPEGLRLRVFDADGRQRATAVFKARFPVSVGGEVAPGLLALGVSPFRGVEGVGGTLFVDLATGNVTRHEPSQSPAIRRWRPAPGGELQSLEPGSFSTGLFVGKEGLVLADPASGSRTVLISRSES